MRTKSVVLVGITLCTMLLVSPVLASSVYTLGIYGNANEDDTIDMRDLTYVKLIFFGKKPETDLSDAKYDGKINPLDFIQIKLIIVGKEKELTLIDSADRTVTVKEPLTRLVVINSQTAEVIRSLKATDRIVGVDKYTLNKDLYFREMQDIPNVGSVYDDTDYEGILELQPEAVFIYASPTAYTSPSAEEIQNKLEAFGITVIRFDFFVRRTMIEETKKLGYILGQREEAEELIDFYEGHMNTIEERVEELSEEDKPRVYFECWTNTNPYWTCGGGTAWDEKIVMAGGKNIFSDLPYDYVEVDPEAVIERDPEIILAGVIVYDHGKCVTGYGVDDLTILKESRGNIMSRPELEKVSAVTNEEVYIINNWIVDGQSQFIGMAYMAKWLHPDLFKDLDPQAIHQEYLDRFQGIDFDVCEHGVWVYPPLKD